MEENVLDPAAETGLTRVRGGHRLEAGRMVRTSSIELSEGLIRTVDSTESASATTIDADGLLIAPGFVDLQINGGYGFDLVGDPASMWDLGRELPRHGVTSFLPTIITSPPDTTVRAMQALQQRPAGYVGAEPVGLHFEGPMLSPQRPGAHPVEHLVPASHSVISEWSRTSGVALVTIAPELHGASTIIAELAARGVTVAAGHTEADAAQAEAGRQAGVTMVTHLFNAMSPLGHRNPNLVGLALAESAIIAGLIADGVHVDPIAIAAAWNAKGPNGLVLVTDAVAPMGLGPGRYEFARHTITADERSVRNEAGTLAGSILTLDQAVRNLRSFTGCSSADALCTVTSTPADVIGLIDRGRIEAGLAADLVLLDEQLNVQLTICGGKVVYVSDTAAGRIDTR